MAATIGTLAVKLAVYSGEFDRQLSVAAKQIKKIGRAAEEVAKVSGVAFAGMTAGIVLATRESSDALKVERQLEAAFKATGQALDLPRFQAFANAMQANTATSDDAVIGMGALMASFQMSQGQIEALIPGILDLSAATGAAADTIAQKLAVAIESGDASLKRYGISMTAAEQEAFKMGTTADRTAMLVQKLGMFQGQAAAEVSTASGKFEQMRNALGNTLEEVGKILDKPLAAMFEAVGSAASMVTNIIANLSPEAKSLFAELAIGGTVVLGLTTALAGIVTVAPAVIAAMSKIGAVMLKVVLPAVAAVALALAGVIAGAELGNKILGGEWGGGVDILKGKVEDLAAEFQKLMTVAPEAMATVPSIAGKMGSGGSGSIDFSGIDSGQFDVGVTDATGLYARLNGVVDSYVSDLEDANANEIAARLEGAQRVADATRLGAEMLLDAVISAQEIDVNAPQNAADKAQQNKQVGSSVLSAGYQGMAVGGPWAALGAMIAKILSMTKGFSQILGWFGQIIGKVIPIFNKLVGALWPIISLWMKQLGWLVSVIGWVVDKISKVIHFFIGLIGGVWNWIIKEIASFFDWLHMHGTAKKVRKLSMDLSGPPEDAAAADSLGDLGDAADSAAGSIGDMAAELLNVPEGFKIDLARFNATNGYAGATSPTALPTSAPPIVIEQVVVQAEDPAELARKLRHANEWADFTITGSTVGDKPYAGTSMAR